MKLFLYPNQVKPIKRPDSFDSEGIKFVLTVRLVCEFFVSVLLTDQFFVNKCLSCVAAF